MIITTTPNIESRPIQAYHGIVVGEVIVGANMFRDLFAGIRDIVGGRSGAYEDVLERAREEALCRRCKPRPSAKAPMLSSQSISIMRSSGRKARC